MPNEDTLPNTPPDTPYDAGNRRHVERKEKTARTRRARLAEAVRWIAGDARGQRYLADLVRESGALERVVATDPDTVMFLDGQRSIGFKVLNDVRSLEDTKSFTALVNGALTGETDGTPDGTDV
ncbi:MAG TPA: hypothetical protein VGM96_31370 [Reyranella sp.]|jgi:hypothetical protein